MVDEIRLTSLKTERIFSSGMGKLSHDYVPNPLLNSVLLQSQVTPAPVTCYPGYSSLGPCTVSKCCPLVHCNSQQNTLHFGGRGGGILKQQYFYTSCLFLRHSSLIQKVAFILKCQ